MDVSKQITLPATGRAVEPRPASQPTSVGRYMIIEEIAEGGMGVVYAAFDPKLDRKVAVKLVRVARGGGEESRARLVREAQAMARLSHPNVVSVFDVGEHGDHGDQLFVAMEFVRGQTLAAWLEEPRPWREVLEHFIEAGRGLAAAHAAGLVHRDFKPENVLVDERGAVKVTDFGLAMRGGEAQSASADVDSTEDGSRSGSESALDNRITRAGKVMGTPAYMSIEQHLGQEVDARSDQFSFAVALYEGLYRSRPYGGESLAELAATLIRGRPRDPPASSRVPSWVRAAVMRGVSASPSDRFPSMEAMLAELQRDPGEARWRWIGAFVLVTLAVSVTFAVMRARTSELAACQGAQAQLQGVWDREREAAIGEAFRATAAPYAADVLTDVSAALRAHAEAWAAMHTAACEAHLRGEQSDDLLDRRMACLERDRVALAAVTEVLATADRGVVKDARTIVAELPPVEICADLDSLLDEITVPPDVAVRGPAATIRARLSRSRVLESAGRYDAARELEDDALARARELGWRPLIAEALYDQGNTLTSLGEFAKAEAGLEEAYFTAQAVGHDDIAAKVAIQLVYVVGYSLARVPDGLRWARHARAAVERVGDRVPLRVDVLDKEATVLNAKGDYPASLKLYEEAIELLHAYDDVDIGDPWARTQLAGLLINSAIVLSRQGDHVEGERRFRRALAILTELNGETHPSVAWALGNLGASLTKQDKYEEALATNVRSLELREGELGADHPSMVYAHWRVARSLSDLGRHEEALPNLQRALEISIASLGSTHATTGNSYSRLGHVYAKLGRWDESRVEMHKALEILRAALEDGHPEIGSTLAIIGEIELEAGRPAEARAPLEEALRIFEARAVDPRTRASVHLELARAVWGADRDRARAEALARQSEALYAGLDDEEQAKARAFLAELPAGDD